VPELQPGAEAQEDRGAEFHWDTKQRDTHMRAGWGNKSRLKRVRKKVLDVLRSPAQRLQFYLCQLRAKDAATPIANKSACRARHSMACLAVQLGQHSSPGAVVCTRWHRVPREGVVPHPWEHPGSGGRGAEHLMEVWVSLGTAGVLSQLAL